MSTNIAIHPNFAPNCERETLAVTVLDSYPALKNVNCVGLVFGDTEVTLFNLNIATAEALCMAARLDMARVKRDESELAKSEAESGE